MVKLAAKTKIKGYAVLYLPRNFNPELNEKLKAFPGVKWDRQEKAWAIPKDLIESVRLELGEPIPDYVAKPIDFSVLTNNHSGFNRLFDYQKQSVLTALAEGGRMLAYETGVGKTPPACVAIGLSNPARTVIVCPGTLRYTWAEQMEAFNDRKYNTLIVLGSKDWAKLTDETELVITTYELLKKGLPLRADAIILDEAHHIKNAKSAKSAAALQFRLANPQAFCLLLTATPIANAPSDVWHQLTVLWPGRVGTFWQFCTRYANVLWNGYGHLFTGVSEDPTKQSELRSRLACLADRVTKLDIAHLLPPLNVSTVRVPYDRKLVFRELEEKWRDVSQAHKYKLDVALMRAGDAKLDFAKEHLATRLEQYKHVVVFTYRKELARKLADTCTDRPVKVITGDVPSHLRTKLLEECRVAEASLVCATMDSIGEGIDLTYAHLGILAELTYKQRVLNQVLGRFCRVNGQHSVDIEFLILESTVDEQVGIEVLNKVKTMNSLIKAGKTEEVLENALSLDDSDEGFLTRIIQAANDSGDTDIYG